MAGHTIDSTAVVVKLTRKLRDDTKVFELVADVDVRQRSAADALAGTDDPCTVALFDDPVLQRLLTARSARAPIVVEIPTDHPAWLAAAGRHAVLGKVRQASRPVFYVRPGLLPAKPSEGDQPTWTVTWSTAAAEAAEVPQHNVLALWPGTDKKDEFVVVSAHYDHIGVGRAVDGDAIHNGADDNATGTTGVLLLAEALAKLPPCRR
ncbi:MAG: M28 family peptidase, partial [Planctomycetes bacterium]|nr:M28 family peptidase [Planctomycetota bacterium]